MSITLTRASVPDNPVSENQHTWPLKVTCVSTIDGIPSEIFVYHVPQAGTLNGGVEGDIFEAVASVHQLNEIGKQPALTGNRQVPYYRSAQLLFQCRSQKEADDLWQAVLEDVEELKDNFNSALSLRVEATVVI